MNFSNIPIRENDKEVDAGWWNILRLAGITLANFVSNKFGNGSIERTIFNFSNNQSAAADIDGLVFDSDLYHSAKIEMDIHRKTSTTEVFERTELYATFAAGAWKLSQGPSTANSGVNFTTTTSGQAQYSSTNLTGTQEINSMTFRTTTMGAV